MNHKLKILFISLFSVVISITTVYAVTLIKASDVIYDNSKSGGSSNNVQGAIDDLYSRTGDYKEILINEPMINYITELANYDTTNLIYDDTPDRNLRYIGANPNNYVEFNGELWRIIGVMNNIKDSSNTSASRVKLIRADSIGDYSYDNKPAGTGSSTWVYGSTVWSDSSLQKVLNEGPYYNRTEGVCPVDKENGVTYCTFSGNGLTSLAKSMISTVKWNLGGSNNVNANAKTIYNDENGNIVYNDGPVSWVGKVGLMYASDYGYAVGGSERNTCLNKEMSSYNDNECYTNNWLYHNNYQWTINHGSNTRNFFVRQFGNLYATVSTDRVAVRPVIYLSTKLLITKGSGKVSNPYQISFEKEISQANDTSNASPPKIDDEEKLKPVKLADDGTVTYVSQDDEEWYNYSEKKWANAVILVDSPSQKYKIGDTIKESDIESYFVWIPKYKYRLWNTGEASKNVHEIDIVFDTKDTTDIEGKSCKTPMTSGSTGNCNNGEYMTHPAFISLGVDGFWVGKFETGYKGATSATSAQVNSSDSSKIIIKPNIYSWRRNAVYNIFVTSYNYERDLDSHMMKNTEWGAVSYLSHSKYGINREININNNSSFKTGYSALPTINQYTYPGDNGDGASYNQMYNSEVGYTASTTGNISGIYDMNGGSWEYVSAYINGNSGSSGFSTTTLYDYNAKYFDVYDSSSSMTTNQYRILGDATGETGPFKQYLDGDNNNRWHSNWYGNHSYFVDSTNPWFIRGGNYSFGVIAGIFSFSRYTGDISSNDGSRIVLTG